MRRLVGILSFAALCVYVSEISEYNNVNASSPLIPAEYDPEAEAAEREKEKAELYPFVPADPAAEEEEMSSLFGGGKASFDKDIIVGIKLKKNKIIYFTNETTYYTCHRGRKLQ